ncbi:hypothetical protein OS122_02655 [Mycolicibacterium mucogenicum]|nr:hypothetical protein [Mycolicibacterium mucogenicum]MCX8559800.1 hypothetical protein [Mycolicibacterium mucogenicum]
MSDPRITALFTPEQLRAMGRCAECGWAPAQQGHRPGCTTPPDTEEAPA